MKNYVQDGDTLALTAPSGGVTSGDGVLIGSIFGIAKTTALAGALVSIAIEGVFTLPKAAGGISQGAKVYWDSVAKNVTTTSSGNSLIGVATADAASGDATATVRLNGVSI